MSAGLKRIGICEIQDLRDRLVYLLQADPDCPDMFPGHPHDSVREMQIAFQWLEDLCPDPRKTILRSPSWTDGIDDFICENWEGLIHRERALAYILAHDPDE